jgi:hypothetical protein
MSSGVEHYFFNDAVSACRAKTAKSSVGKVGTSGGDCLYVPAEYYRDELGLTVRTSH